ncbi:hypothetical protein [Oxynema aestuarii]|nr:hypothetical protein [Oxynema aestuarii]
MLFILEIPELSRAIARDRTAKRYQIQHFFKRSPVYNPRQYRKLI